MMDHSYDMSNSGDAQPEPPCPHGCPYNLPGHEGKHMLGCPLCPETAEYEASQRYIWARIAGMVAAVEARKFDFRRN